MVKFVGKWKRLEDTQHQRRGRYTGSLVIGDVVKGDND